MEEPGLEAIRGIVGLDKGDDPVRFVTGCELFEEHGLSGAAQAHERGVDPRLRSGEQLLESCELLLAVGEVGQTSGPRH